MKPELMLLVWTVLLTFVQMLIAVNGAILQVGLVKLAGNRDDLLLLGGWVGRAQRAHLNMLQNLGMFAILVLVAVVANKTNAMTLLGAQIFFWFRVVYTVVYLIGIPWVRTLVWTGSLVGLAIIFLQLI